MKYIFMILCLLINLHANKADVTKARATCTSNYVCTVKVTIGHKDENIDHFVDKWEIFTTKGKRIATKTLKKPNKKTKFIVSSLKKVKFPKKTKEITIVAHDSKHGYGGKEKVVKVLFMK